MDVWDTAIKTYQNNNDHLALCRDLTKYAPDAFSKEHNIPKGTIDIIAGGPPCQGFSIAGRRDKNDPRNSLFIEFYKYVDFYEPKAFIMENVMGILSMKTSNGEKCIDIILSMFEKKYNTVVNKLYASDYNVPQNRRRVIIIGVRKDLEIVPSEPPKIIENIRDRIPVSTILLDEGDIPDSYFLSEKAITGINRKKERMKEEKKGFGAQYLHLDKPSYTIPARYWKDGYDALVKYSDSKIRRLTEVELARIQTFPEGYAFSGNKKDVIMQIGNALPCEFAYHISCYVKKLIEECDSKINISDYNYYNSLDDKELNKLCRNSDIDPQDRCRSDIISLLSDNILNIY